jgi:hypothetical protein
VITILGYIIAFGGIYIFVGSFRGGHDGLSATPFSWPGGSSDVLLTFSLAVLAFDGVRGGAHLGPGRRPERAPAAGCAGLECPACGRAGHYAAGALWPGSQP